MAVLLYPDAFPMYILTVRALFRMLLVIATAYNLLFLLAMIKYGRKLCLMFPAIELGPLNLESKVRAG